MSRAVITWQGGTKTIEGAKPGDTRITEALDQLEAKRAKNVCLEFQDEFDLGRYIDDEEVYD